MIKACLKGVCKGMKYCSKRNDHSFEAIQSIEPLNKVSDKTLRVPT